MSNTIQILADSVAKTISSFSHLPTTAGSPGKHEATASLGEVDIAGLIRFEGAALSIELALCLDKKTFLMLCEGASLSADEISSDNRDLVAEILNVAFGVIDPQLRAQGLTLKSSFPLHFTDSQLNSLKRSLALPHVAIPLTTHGQTFHLRTYPSGTFKQNWNYTPRA